MRQNKFENGLNYLQFCIWLHFCFNRRNFLATVHFFVKVVKRNNIQYVVNAEKTHIRQRYNSVFSISKTYK